MSFAILHLLSFLHFFRCFSGENGSFVLQIVQFSRTWCSNHFVSYFEIQILHVSKFFNDFRGNRNLQKNEKKEKRGKKRSTNKATDKKRKTNATFLFACQRCVYTYPDRSGYLDVSAPDRPSVYTKTIEVYAIRSNTLRYPELFENDFKGGSSGCPSALWRRVGAT